MATFRQRGGRWQAIIRRNNLKASKAFDRLVDAKAWARAQEREADLAGTLPTKMAGTLGAVIERYERELWPSKRWGHSKAHDLKMLARDLGPRLLADLTKQAFVAYARGLDVAPSTASHRLLYLREVLRAARDLWGASVPLAELEAAITATRQQKIIGRSLVRTRRPTADELARIIAAADDREQAQIDLGAVVRVLSTLPLRLGELCGIQWDDIDAERRTVVLRQRKHPDRRVKEASVDIVPLITFRGVDTFDLVVNRPRYMASPFPYKSTSVTSAFADVVARLGIPNLRLHDLRAHALSSLLEAGLPIPQVALISGHRNWSVLARVYARIDPASVHDALSRLS